MNEILLALSGGIDSATLLAYALRMGHPVSCVGFTYGSKHNSLENAAAEQIAQHYNVPFQNIDISGTMRNFKSDLLKGGKAIPEGHYTAENMKSTVVPGRNMIIISILAGLADSLGIGNVAIGVHKGDHTIYPDCRKVFIDAMRQAVLLATDHQVNLYCPFIDEDKTKIVSEGINLRVPYELTRTCYTAQEIACGKCGSCAERLEAFANCTTSDPIEYAILAED